MRVTESEPGPGELTTAVVICAVFAIVLAGMIVLHQRQQAVAAWAAQTSAVAEGGATPSAAPTPTRSPSPDPPGAYTVRRGDSLFSVAADVGVSPNELIYWNRETYPTIQSTPALRPGWVLRIEGPPLPTPTPEPTVAPTPEPILAAPSVPGLPTFTAASFPASDRVTVTWYLVDGASPREILESIEDNGPWSEWAAENATAHVLVQPSFDFVFETDAAGTCVVAPTADPPVSITYRVMLPAWSPSEGASVATIEWWADQLTRTVAHEAHHVTLYEEHLVAMREVVATATCDALPDALQVVWDGALQANCEFDLAEYGRAAGLTLESCLALGR